MRTSVDVHVNRADDIEMTAVDKAIYDTVALDVGEDLTLWFKDTAAARVFLARCLSELRRIERGDLPYNTTDDRIEVREYEVLSKHDSVEVTA